MTTINEEPSAISDEIDYKQIFRDLPDATIIIDPLFNLKYVNTSFIRLFSRGNAEILNKNFADLIGSSQIPFNRTLFSEFLSGPSGEPYPDLIFSLQEHPRQCFQCRKISTFNLRGPQLSVLRLIVVVHES